MGMGRGKNEGKLGGGLNGIGGGGLEGGLGG